MIEICFVLVNKKILFVNNIKIASLYIEKALMLT